eukprot:CAMPEP_0168571756 /NCGR_PEP_ID=MMETSP0413-20121227/17533_1 /TAXON_ID=136452 /ORGANISM="Filamoeba nolandi, Strain NC-AS-23-1" /LENGTH=132 /DNA_ID=CAMNT_0008604685 /DNA_START=22 /DNA_END=417 /DNA_ORIENTATION=-
MYSWVLFKLCESNEWVFGIATDNNGNIYFTTNNSNVYHIQEHEKNSKPMVIISIQRAVLRGIVWNNNTLYLCDNWNHRIWSFEVHTGNLQNLAGNGENAYEDGNIEKARFWYPQGITVDQKDNLFITEGAFV